MGGWEVAVLDGVGDVVGGGAEDGEVVGVVGLECGVWLSGGSVFGL